MSAQYIYDAAPLGALIRFSDGAPRPPERHHRKLSDWRSRNNVGRLVRKDPETRLGDRLVSASFLLRLDDIAGVVMVRARYSVASPLCFEIAERPPTGSVRIIRGEGDEQELIHLAANGASAEAWVRAKGYKDARLEVVCDDGAPSEGRAA